MKKQFRLLFGLIFVLIQFQDKDVNPKSDEDFYLKHATTPTENAVSLEKNNFLTLTATASWYGFPFHGRKTANGEIFNLYSLTAAHPYFRWGTKLRLFNPENKKEVIVRINDRGPYIRGRDLDLSFEAARRLGMVEAGVVKLVILEIIQPKPPKKEAELKKGIRKNPT
jgi:rare lipoprotein A